MDSLKAPLALAGVLALVGGLGAWLVAGEFALAQRILLAGGVLLIGVVVALDPEGAWALLTGRGALYSGNTLVIALAIIGILGLVNVLGSRYQTSWDLTSNQQFTLAPESVEVAKTLPEPVKASVFLSGTDSRKSDYEGLLNKYAADSGGKFSYEFIDPEQKPGVAQALGVTQFGTTVYQMGDKKQTSTGTAESDITTALIKLTRPQKHLYFTTGHGERQLSGFNQPDYGQINQALGNDNFKTDSLNLITARTVPSDADAVVIAGPTDVFAPQEIDALKAYLDGGGAVMILQDPNSKTDFSSLLEPYGVAFTHNYAVDPTKAFFGDPLVPVADTYGSHATTKGLSAASFYPDSSTITTPATPPQGVTITTIAQTSSNGWGESSQQEVQSGRPQQDDQDQKGPVAMVVAIEQPVAGTATPTPTPDQSGSTPPPSGKTSRLFLVGTASMVANNALSLNVPAGNQDLFMNAANWLAEQQDLVSIRPKDTVNRSVLLQGNQLNLVFYSSALFLPLVVLGAGAAVWWARR